MVSIVAAAASGAASRANNAPSVVAPVFAGAIARWKTTDPAAGEHRGCRRRLRSRAADGVELESERGVGRRRSRGIEDTRGTAGRISRSIGGDRLFSALSHPSSSSRRFFGSQPGMSVGRFAFHSFHGRGRRRGACGGAAFPSALRSHPASSSFSPSSPLSSFAGSPPPPFSEHRSDGDVFGSSDAPPSPPPGVIRRMDFFGEPVTFLDRAVDGTSIDASDGGGRGGGGGATTAILDPEEALASFDGFSLVVTSRGGANLNEGNDGEGIEARASHASAASWADLIEHAWEWNGGGDDGGAIAGAPMLAVAAAAPVLAQGGLNYARRIDCWLARTAPPRRSAQPSPNPIPAAAAARNLRPIPPSLVVMAQNAVSLRDRTDLLTPRERWHLYALDELLAGRHRSAAGAYLRLLEMHPGDLLGLSLAMDTACASGDRDVAMRAACIVSSYWTDREGGSFHLRPGLAGHPVASALVALGLAAGGRAHDAELMAEESLSRDADGAGGVASWALAHALLGSEGRTSEAMSKLAGSDGAGSYERCGLLHHDARMGGYGALALLDRQGAGADRAATRMYDNCFGRVLEYSGNVCARARRDEGGEEGDEENGDVGLEELRLGDRRVPSKVREDIQNAAKSMFTGWFGGGVGDAAAADRDSVPSSSENKRDGLPPLPTTTDANDIGTKPGPRTIEDVLTWLPPSPLLLTHATSLLFRLTLSGGVDGSDRRWADLRVAWKMAMTSRDGGGGHAEIKFMTLALVASSLVVDPSPILSFSEIANDDPIVEAMTGLHKMGKLLKLGESDTTSASVDDEDDEALWKEVLHHLARVRDADGRWEMSSGISSRYNAPPSSAAPLRRSRDIGWDLDVRQFYEQALCRAALKVGDYESLCLARSVCSEGTTLRSNCPEVWSRYSEVLDALGDNVAAQNARAASVSLGAGEGGSQF